MTEITPKPFVFVLMPFASEFDDIYKLGIKAACQEAGAYCERVDEQISRENILERVYNQIGKADIVVSDMTGRNPNVFYESGYAHALGKHVILLTQRADDIPFDLKHYPHIIYEGKITRLKEELQRRVRWAIENPKAQLAQADSYLRFYLSGKELTNKVEITFKIGDDISGTRQLRFLIDVQNTSNTVVGATSIEIGLILPIEFVNSVGLSTVRLPDGRCMHLLPKLGRFLPNSWQPIPVRVDVQNVETLRGKNYECTIRLFNEMDTRDINYKMRVS
jgi:hypothetical protein